MYSKILPGLYLSGQPSLDSMPEEVEAVLNLRRAPSLYPPKVRVAIGMPIADDFPFPGMAWLNTATDLVHQLRVHSNLVTLVHCAAGISRSPMVVIGYLMKYHNMTFDQAHDHVGRERPIISPNSYFRNGLREFERLLATR